jgi:hypothetical protein
VFQKAYGLKMDLQGEIESTPQKGERENETHNFDYDVVRSRDVRTERAALECSGNPADLDHEDHQEGQEVYQGDYGEDRQFGQEGLSRAGKAITARFSL